MNQTLQHWIDGKAVSSPATMDVFDPSTGQVIAQCPKGGAATVEQAVRAAERAFPAWSQLPHSERARWLDKLAQALADRVDDFALAECRNGGKPLALARTAEIPRALQNLRFFAAAATQFASESHHGEAGLNYTLRSPLGVVGCISPWNLPLYLFTWKIAPALAAGNCVVAKPSEVTPLTASMLGALAAEIGFPHGVLNIVQGTGHDVGPVVRLHPASPLHAPLGSGLGVVVQIDDRRRDVGGIQHRHEGVARVHLGHGGLVDVAQHRTLHRRTFERHVAEPPDPELVRHHV